MMSRREFGSSSFAALMGIALAQPNQPVVPGVHEQILDLARGFENTRRERYFAIKNKNDLISYQEELREKFLMLIDGLPKVEGLPPVRKFDVIDADDYTITKLVYESFPGYFVPALLYQPKKLVGKAPGILSPCGHSTVGKAAISYQMLHINLAKRGYIVLTFDPVGQGERSQFWNVTKNATPFGLSCGEHAMLGNPLYLLGTSLARYRIFDGIRGLDYLESLPDVDPKRLGCIGSSGGGTLTAYISALDPRVAAAVISCYITTLPRRMGNRIERDPDSDPEQDIFGSVSEGIDHAGLLALRAPKPTRVSAARDDFFPIEGARESYAETKPLYERAEAGDALGILEVPEKHGLSLPQREGAYAWFDLWFREKKDRTDFKEHAVTPRSTKELQVCAEGQVQITLKSRPLLKIAVEEFQARAKSPRVPLAELLHLDPKSARFDLTELRKGEGTAVILINGNESADWRSEKDFLTTLKKEETAVYAVDTRGIGRLRPDKQVKGHDYADPLCGVEENIAYNAFLVGRTLLGMRVADVIAAMSAIRETKQFDKIVLVGRRDAALITLFTAALAPKVTQVALEEMPLSYWNFFDVAGVPINAASIVPRILRDYGDIAEVLSAIAPRKALIAAGKGKLIRDVANTERSEKLFSREPDVLVKWI